MTRRSPAHAHANALATVLVLVLGIGMGLTACADPFVAEPVRLYTAVATGGDHSCAIATDGSAWCWGKGTDGELGTGVKADRETPAAVKSSVAFKDITAGTNHTCGLSTDGTAYCWGWNAFYERGNTSDPRDAEPVPVSTNVKFLHITAGANHTCALSTDSIAYCWGANQYGQLGDGSTHTRAQPLPVAGNARFAQLSAGAWHTCALTAAGVAYCWGRNDSGQLGNGGTAPHAAMPTPVSSSVRFQQIDGGKVHTCAVALDTQFYCWGGNPFGEMGTGGATPAGPDATVPRTISALFPTGRAISAGEHNTCAIDASGNARCWGLGVEGQLGNGNYATHYQPQPVHLQPSLQHTADLFTITTLATGGNTHVCAIADRRVYCWGSGPRGQLGVAGSRIATLPQRVEN